MTTDHRALLHRFWDGLSKGEFDIIDEVVDADFVEEYPQSGEVIRGRDNLRRTLEGYPGGLGLASHDIASSRVTTPEDRYVLTPMFTLITVKDLGDKGTAMLKVRYPDGSTWWMVAIYELRNGRLSRQTTFFCPLFEAPEWRAPFVKMS